MNKKLFLIFVIFVSLILFQVIFVSAEFSKSNVSSWGENKDSIKKFEALSDKDKNDVWKKATPQEKEKFVKAYSESKDRKIDFEGFSSKDLSWEGNQLVAVNGKKKPSFNFDSKDSLKKVIYDEKTKTITYEFEKGSVKNQFKTDDGYIDKDGYLSKDKSELGFTGYTKKTEKIANVVMGNGLLEYKDGAFYINSEGRSVKIGNNYYSQFQSGEQTIIRPDSNGAVSSHNAKILLMEKENSESASAVLTTSSGKLDGKPKFVAFFDGKKVPENFKEPYAYFDMAAKKAVLNDPTSTKESSTYMQAELFSNFNEIKGSGFQTWVKNGNAQFNFQEGKLNFAEGTRKGNYEIDFVSNLNNKDLTKNVFTFKKYKDSTYADFFERGGTLVDSGALISETSGMYVYGPRGRQLGGDSQTSYSDLEYSQALEQGYFDGTEAERLAAIANDPNTVVGIHGSPRVDIPGQLAAAQILENLDYQLAVAQLQAGDMGKDINLQMDQMKLLVGQSDLSNPQVRESILNQMMDGASVKGYTIVEGTRDVFAKQNPGISEFEIRQKTEQLVDGYIIRSNYNPQLDMSSVKPEEVSKLPSVNRILYEAATTYRGSVSIPDSVREARKSGGASSDGGVSTIQFSSNGVYFDGTQIQGVKPEVATALKTSVANGLLNFEQGVADRQAQVVKYGTKINQAGYAFDINDYKTIRNENNVYTSGLIGAKQVGACALAAGKCQLASKEAKYQYYQTNKKLP